MLNLWRSWLLVAIVIGPTATLSATPDIAVYRTWDGAQQARGSTFTFSPVATGVADSRRFEIRNAGDAPLTISNAASIVSGSACFSQIETPAGSVAAGGSTFVRVRILCGTPGTYSGTVSIGSNDPDENPYSFAISGTVTGGAPEVQVVRMWDGGTVGSGGSVAFPLTVAGTATSLRFRVDNIGTSTLTLGTPAIGGGCFDVVELPAPSVPAGGATYFRVQALCGSAGSHSGMFSMPNSDADENPFALTFTITVSPPPAPDTSVLQSWDGVPIPNGGSFTFPAVAPNVADSRLFTIANNGNAPLTISNASTLVSGTCFSTPEIPATTIAAGAASSVRIRVLCGTPGIHHGQISISTNDPNKSPYTFAVHATVRGNSAAFVSQSIPGSMLAGRPYAVSVTMLNDGGTAWAAATDHRLGIQPPGTGSTWGGVGRVYLATGEQVAPGAQKTWSFTVTAPSTPGTYTMQWQMVQENVEWFGPVTPPVSINVTAGAANSAAFVAQSVPATMAAGRTYPVWIEMRNSGTTDWTASSSHRLGALTPAPGNTWGTGRVYLASAERIQPGQSKRFSFNVTAPSTPGAYDFRWQMLQELVEWFGEMSPNVRVTVATPPRVDSSSPDQVPRGAITTITLAGAGLENASAAIATVKPSPAFPDRVHPSASVVANPADGRSLQVRIDATNPEIDGFYNLVVQNARGSAMVPIRVVGNAPVIDLSTPTEVGGDGSLFVLMIAGANLRGATVSVANLPGVSLLDVDNSTDFITGLVSVDGGAIGNGQLVVRGANGAQSSVPLKLVTPGSFSKTTTDATLQAKSATGVNAPPIYVQAPTRWGSSSDDTFPCSARYRAFDRTLARYQVFNPDTGRRIDNLLRLIPGNKVRVGTRVTSIRATLDVVATAVCSLSGPATDISTCLSGQIDIEIPFLPGTTCTTFACNGYGGAHCTGMPAGGKLTGYSFSPGSCVLAKDLNTGTDPSQPNWHRDSGQRYADVELAYCCRDQLTGSFEAATAAGISFSIENAPLLSAEPSTSCPEVEPVFKLFLNSDTVFSLTSPASDDTYTPGSDGKGASVALPQTIEVVGAFVDQKTGAVLPPAPAREPYVPTGAINFKLENTSAFDGYAMNAGTSAGPDFLLLRADANGVAAEAFRPDNTARASLGVHDYGGFTTVLADVGGIKAALRIPLDDNGDLLPDRGWVVDGTRIAPPSTAREDLDAIPAVSGLPSSGCRGDGLSAYEEYRGFRVNGVHTRTSPMKKDLFVFTQNAGNLSPTLYNSIGIGHLAATGLAVHRLGSNNELAQNHQINYMNANRATTTPPLSFVPGDFQQNAAVLSFDDSDPDVRCTSLTSALGWTQTSNCMPNIPQQTVASHVLIEPMQKLQGYMDSDGSFELRGWQYVASHELGHGIHMCHTGKLESSSSCAAQAVAPWQDINLPLDIMHTGLFGSLESPSLNPKKRFPPDTWDPADLAQIRIRNNQPCP